MNKTRFTQIGFNLIAPFYNSLKRVFLKNNPEKVISKAIELLGFYSSVLVVGGGADNTVLELIQLEKTSQICHVDLSSGLSQLARKRISILESKSIKLDFEVCSFVDFETTQKFDLIIVPFFLDLFTKGDLVKNIHKMKKVLSPTGKVMVVDFNSTKSFWNTLKISGLYCMFLPITGILRSSIPNYEKHFKEAGFSLVYRKEYLETQYQVLFFGNR